MEKNLEERIKSNIEMFNEKEVEMMLHNIKLFAKIYLLGIIDVYL